MAARCRGTRAAVACRGIFIGPSQGCCEHVRRSALILSRCSVRGSAEPRCRCLGGGLGCGTRRWCGAAGGRPSLSPHQSECPIWWLGASSGAEQRPVHHLKQCCTPGEVEAIPSVPWFWRSHPGSPAPLAGNSLSSTLHTALRAVPTQLMDARCVPFHPRYHREPQPCISGSCPGVSFRLSIVLHWVWGSFQPCSAQRCPHVPRSCWHCVSW